MKHCLPLVDNLIHDVCANRWEKEVLDFAKTYVCKHTLGIAKPNYDMTL